ncbi:MAG TPA: M20/M25/M40 family metallo-hydrolase [Acidobacteriota bacterium]|nr:M20/M25/M40 family metallo-hydrolase [Acidobacteriota bacterium]
MSSAPTSPRTHFRTWVLAFFLPLAIAALSIYHITTPPAVLPATAPPTEFSAERAMTHLWAIAQRPHPSGSIEHQKVREYLVARLKELGLQTEVQKTTALVDRWETAGTVHNILARFPGTNPTKAVMLAAHYDSVPTGPGASDDGAGVAGILEAIRALKSAGPLRNDVIVLFTDSEELGLLGASAFVDEHPWAKDVGVVFNFEARGNRGCSLLFETSEQNGWLMAEVAKAGAYTIGNSLFYEVYRRLPNDSDMTMFKRGGMIGCNFAFSQGILFYHSALDHPAYIEQRSLQHHGGYMLNLTRHFGRLDLSNPPRQANVVYFELPFGKLVWYPQVWTLIGLGALMFLMLAVGLIGVRSQQLTLSGIFLGILAMMTVLVPPALVVWGLWSLIHALSAHHQAFAYFEDAYQQHWYLLGFTSLTVAIISALWMTASQKVSWPNLAYGALFIWTVLAIIAIRFFPGGAFLFMLPALASALSLGILFVRQWDDWTAWRPGVVLSLGMLPALYFMSPLILCLVVALTLKLAWVAMIVVGLLLGLLLPQIAVLHQTVPKRLPLLALTVGVICLITGGLKTRVDYDHRQPNMIFYALNADTNQAFWVSDLSPVDDWERQFLKDTPTRRSLPDFFPISSSTFQVSPASVAPIEPALAEVLSDERTADSRKVRLRVRSPRLAERLSLYFEDTELRSLAVNGKAFQKLPKYQAKSGPTYTFDYVAPPADGLVIDLETVGTNPIKLVMVDQSLRLPPLPGFIFIHRTEEMMPSIRSLTDSTFVVKTVTL